MKADDYGDQKSSMNPRLALSPRSVTIVCTKGQCQGQNTALSTFNMLSNNYQQSSAFGVALIADAWVIRDRDGGTVLCLCIKQVSLHCMRVNSTYILAAVCQH
jgi:hypothetical protein